MMTPILTDIAIVLIILISALRGLKDGFAKSVLKFVGWIISLVGAYFLMPISRSFLYANTALYESVNFEALPAPFAQLTADMLFSILCFVVGFIVIKIIINIIAMLIPTGDSLIGKVNQTVGLLFGIARGLLIVAFILLAIVPLVTLLDPAALPVVTQNIHGSYLGGFLSRYNPIMILLNAIF